MLGKMPNPSLFKLTAELISLSTIKDSISSQYSRISRLVIARRSRPPLSIDSYQFTFSLGRKELRESSYKKSSRFSRVKSHSFKSKNQQNKSRSAASEARQSRGLIEDVVFKSAYSLEIHIFYFSINKFRGTCTFLIFLTFDLLP